MCLGGGRGGVGCNGSATPAMSPLPAGDSAGRGCPVAQVNRYGAGREQGAVRGGAPHAATPKPRPWGVLGGH